MGFNSSQVVWKPGLDFRRQIEARSFNSSQVVWKQTIFEVQVPKNKSSFNSSQVVWKPSVVIPQLGYAREVSIPHRQSGSSGKVPRPLFPIMCFNSSQVVWKQEFIRAFESAKMASFNSSQVVWKHFHVEVAGQVFLQFQFLIGSLEAEAFSLHRLEALSTVSIPHRQSGSQKRSKVKIIVTSGFNSSQVVWKQAESFLYSFPSYDVSIPHRQSGSGTFEIAQALGTGFNSSQVVWKRYREKFKPLSQREFQFLIGSLEARLQKGRLCISWSFNSSQVVWKPEYKLEASLAPEFQFLIGSLEARTCEPLREGPLVSIPHRQSGSDHVSAFFGVEFTFQFLIGSLEAPSQVSASKALAFQFLIGSLEAMVQFHPCLPAAVSIPHRQSGSGAVYYGPSF